MITVRRSEERGHADHGWLNAFHTFSFARYYDPNHMGFRALRVMNEDRIAAGKGFGTHPHDNMEIVTYVLDGALEHRDSMGNGEVLGAGEFQRMSAGTGITHSEFNPSRESQTHLYQIWLHPKVQGIEPSYEQKKFEPAGRRNQFQLVASPDAEQGALRIHQDVRIYLADLFSERSLDYQIQTGRHVWIQVLRGQIILEALSGSAEVVKLSQGDAAALSQPEGLQSEAGKIRTLRLRSDSSAELMLFDLA
ncbi:pirin family protein [Roseiconus lacunae]|uniref:pirin family protein n=1 Tax=Roseiconus lacunae TaxID=2605694 RepID=UPI0030929B9D|nr:pirin family protein [Stieleria sp. HD01]